MATLASRGTIPKKSITAVLIKGAQDWMPVNSGSFDIVEVNFLDEALGTSEGGIVGIKFATIGLSGRPAWVLTSMDSIAGVQVEQPEPKSNEPPKVRESK